MRPTEKLITKGFFSLPKTVLGPRVLMSKNLGGMVLNKHGCSHCIGNCTFKIAMEMTQETNIIEFQSVFYQLTLKPWGK